MEFKQCLNVFFSDITALGGLVFYLILTGISLLLHNFTLFNQLIMGMLLLYTLVSLGRILYFKERPYKQDYHTFLGKIDAAAFPSMHAARAFFLLFILHYYFNNILVSLSLFGLAILVCYSRLYSNKHDYVDLLGGIVFGLFVGLLVIGF